MKQLIVNADDFGADDARNAGICEAVESGVVTSISILSNGAAFQDAVSRISSPGFTRISVGFHLNLSEGRPLSPGHCHLVGPDGAFLGKKGARTILLDRENLELEEEVRKELTAQLSQLQSAGIQIDHLDGHQHVHLFPAVLKIALNAAQEYGIRWIRIPYEPPTRFNPGLLSPDELQEATFFSDRAAEARAIIQGSGVAAPDHFRGLLFKGKLPAMYWADFLEGIPQGLTELMVHPGYPASPGSGPFSGFSTPDREGELRSLTDGRFRDALLKTGVALSPFPEASIPRCAC